jgi:PelA/Pel-15E family pectate lyase
MRIENPDDQVVGAIDSAVAWLRKTQLSGIRPQRAPATTESFAGYTADFDVIVVPDKTAPPIWARHYEIGTDRSIFAGRNGVKRYSLAEIERERRAGTPWYGIWPRSLIESDYDQWREKRLRTRTDP